MLNAGKRWTSYGTTKMVLMAAAGTPQTTIAKTLLRSPKAIERKMHKLKYSFTRHTRFADFVRIVNFGMSNLDA